MIAKQLLFMRIVGVDIQSLYYIIILSKLGYIHKTVNHIESFVDATSGVHTQRIENTWPNIKRLIKKGNGLKGAFGMIIFRTVWKFPFVSDGCPVVSDDSTIIVLGACSVTYVLACSVPQDRCRYCYLWNY